MIATGASDDHLAVPDLAQHRYAVAAVVFLTVALGGASWVALSSGAWHAAHGQMRTSP